MNALQAVAQRSPLVRRSPRSTALLTSARTGRQFSGQCEGAWCQITKGDERFVAQRIPGRSGPTFKLGRSPIRGITSRPSTSQGRLQPVNEDP